MSHYKPYPAYKDSGVEWVGSIPSSWSVMPLFSVAEERAQSNKGMLEDNLLSLSYGNIVRKDINSFEGLVPESYETYQVVEAGDVVFRLTDLQNDKRSLRSAKCSERGIITSAYVAVAPKQVESGYFSYLMRCYDQVKVFYSMGGGMRQSMKFDDLRRMMVLLPSCVEQQCITSYLDRETARIDALIEKKTRFIELLREKRQALITQAVTKGLDPNVKMKDSGVEWLGEVPEHWAVRPLKYVVTFLSGGTPSKDIPAYWNGSIPWASAKDLKQDRLGKTQDHIAEFAISEGAATLVPEGCVLVVVRGMILARIFPVSEVIAPMAINQDLKAVVPSKDLRGDYLAKVLRGTAGETLSRLEEAGHGTKALRMENWVSMEIPLPPTEEQREIIKYVDEEIFRLDSLAHKTERSIELLKERRSAFITAAVTGQIDLREAA